jgi:hypothetical protein
LNKIFEQDIEMMRKKKEKKKKKHSIYARCFNYDFLNVRMRRESFFFQHIFMFKCDDFHFFFSTSSFSNATIIIFLSAHLRFRMRWKSFVFRTKISKHIYENETKVILQIRSSTQQWQISRFANWINITWNAQRRTNSLIDALKKQSCDAVMTNLEIFKLNRYHVRRSKTNELASWCVEEWKTMNNDSNIWRKACVTWCDYS